MSQTLLSIMQVYEKTQDKPFSHIFSQKVCQKSLSFIRAYFPSDDVFSRLISNFAGHLVKDDQALTSLMCLLDKRQDLYDTRIAQLDNDEMPDQKILCLLIRDISRLICVNNDNSDTAFAAAKRFSAVCSSIIKLSHSVIRDSRDDVFEMIDSTWVQQMITNSFQVQNPEKDIVLVRSKVTELLKFVVCVVSEFGEIQNNLPLLLSYFSDIGRDEKKRQDFSKACANLSRLSDVSCDVESTLFKTEFCFCIGELINISGLKTMVSKPGFIQTFSESVMSSSCSMESPIAKYIEAYLDSLGICVEDISSENKKEMVHSMCRLLSLLLRYDFIGPIRDVIVDSSDVNAYFKHGFFVKQSIKENSLSCYRSTCSLLSLSSRFISSIVSFLDKVEKDESLSICKDGKITKDPQRKRALILLMTFLFDRIGKNRVLASDFISKMLRCKVFNNPGFAKWILMLFNSSLLFCSLVLQFFDFSKRSKWYSDLYTYGYSVYFVVTRSVLQLPRFLYFSVQMLSLILKSGADYFGKLQTFLFSSAVFTSVYCVNASFLSMYLIPVYACVFYCAISLLVDVAKRSYLDIFKPSCKNEQFDLVKRAVKSNHLTDALIIHDFSSSPVPRGGSETNRFCHSH